MITGQLSHEKNNLLSIESWLVNRDPYNVSVFNNPLYNWVVFHPLYTLNLRTLILHRAPKFRIKSRNKKNQKQIKPKTQGKSRDQSRLKKKQTKNSGDNSGDNSGKTQGTTQTKSSGKKQGYINEDSKRGVGGEVGGIKKHQKP